MIPDEHFPEPAVIEPRRRRGVAQPIALEAEGLGVAPVQATRDFLEGLALIPAEIEREFGAAWDKHAGAHEYFTRVVLARLEVLKPKGSSEFGDRPHATLPLPTVLGRDPAQLGSIIENRLRQQPDFTTSATRRLMEDEYRRMQSALTGARGQGQKPPVAPPNESLDHPKKKGRR